MNKGKVYLIGAGPGDPELVTVKGINCIKKADTVIYDRLVAPEILKNCRSDAEMIYAGKGPDIHTMKQEDINNLLLEKSGQNKTVARLKGGDPFVFGRGGEEAVVLAENNIPFEIVPGITSAVAAPAYAGIPVTHRGYTSSVSVITGNEDPDKEDSAVNWQHMAPGTGTLVFLMGMANLPKITEKLIENGRPPSTPVALIRWGTCADQETLTGNLYNISKLAEDSGFKNPAVIVVGDVVNLREKLAWAEKRPLFGRKIIVTRSREQASELSRRITELGGKPLEFPTIKIEPPGDYAPLDLAIENISSFKWIIFTSVNGVKHFMHRLFNANKDIRELKGIKLCAIGPKTKEELVNYGLQVDTMPSEFRAEEIIRSLTDKIKPGDKILLPRADIARKVLPESLQQLGAEVTEIPAYKTVTGTENTEELKEMLRQGEIDLVTFTSSSTVRNFVSMLQDLPLYHLMKNVTVACIGPITGQTAQESGLNVDIQAEEYTINGLIKAIINYYNS